LRIISTIEKLSIPGKGLLTLDTPSAKLPITMARAVADLFPEILVVPFKLDPFTMNFTVTFLL
jgi:hypothetical protein